MSAKRETQSDMSGAFAERIPDNVLLEPIDYIFADHCRQADLCEAIKTFAADYDTAKPDRETAQAILHCLNTDLPLHIADEEQDLFPRLRARALPEDHVAELLRLLDREHERDKCIAKDVRADIQRLAQGKALPDVAAFRRAAATLATMHLSHLNWENAVILPLARKRLSREDLKTIGQAMAARRSIPYPQSET